MEKKGSALCGGGEIMDGENVEGYGCEKKELRVGKREGLRLGKRGKN